MIRSDEQAQAITGFKGLDKSRPVPGDGLTRSLQNVVVGYQRVKGRGGVGFDSTFGTAMSESVLQLMPYTNASSLAVTLLRIGPTKVEKSTGGAWTDVTGTALNGASGDRPQWANFRGTLYFVNEGKDAPRSWGGSGNTAAIASGTAPKAKAIMSYYGFLFLLNIYDSSAGAFAPRRGQYSETPDTDWAQCASNLVNFNETPGEALAGIPWGESAVILKQDGVVILRWVGGQVRFTQKLLQGAPGTLAPLSAQPCGDKGVIYLGDDYQLYLADANSFAPLPPNVTDILQNNLYKASVGNCRSLVKEDQQVYSLFIPLDSSGNTGRIDFNYRTGEFSYSAYSTSQPWGAVQTLRWTSGAAETVVGTSAATAYTLDTADKVDNVSATVSNTVSRYYDTDWIMYANQNEGRIVQRASMFTGATLVFEANAYAKCAVSVAFNHQDNFRFRKVYDLRPKRSGDTYVEVRYDIAPLNVEWVNVRIEFLPNTTSQPVLRSGALHFIPEPTLKDARRTASTTES